MVHRVVERGRYRIVRHPGHAGMLLVTLGCIATHPKCVAFAVRIDEREDLVGGSGVTVAPIRAGAIDVVIGAADVTRCSADYRVPTS